MNSRDRGLADTGLEAKVEALARQNAQLMRVQQRKDRLSALVVHDLKSPLSGIMLNLRWLHGLETGDDVREALGSIETASRAMLRMVMNLLDIGRSVDGALVPHRSVVDVGSLVDGLSACLHRRAEDAGIELTMKVSPGLSLEADRDLLGRVLENLLDNAVRYTPEDGHISVEAERLLGANRVEICVRDDGRGIPADQRERV
ncbi:MAG: ATP-binding protein, partial [Deltaproteobacteria bacterium]